MTLLINTEQKVNQNRSRMKQKKTKENLANVRPMSERVEHEVCMTTELMCEHILKKKENVS